jgi:arylsulfatase
MTFTLEVDGRAIGETAATISAPYIWQFGGTGFCLGYDRPLSVTEDYEPPFPWTGVLRSVIVEVPAGAAPTDLERAAQTALRSE